MKTCKKEIRVLPSDLAGKILLLLAQPTTKKIRICKLEEEEYIFLAFSRIVGKEIPLWQELLYQTMKGLASYCKAETTFTFHFSILTL